MSKGFLVFDIGGTKTSVARISRQSEGFVIERKHLFDSQKNDDFFEILDCCQAIFPEPIDALVIGAAGPVLEGKVDITNLPWNVRLEDVQKKVQAPVFLVNDLVLHGFGLLTKSASEVELKGGQHQLGHKVLVAPGTGLGEAWIFWRPNHKFGGSYQVYATEGGHATFSPISERGLDFQSFLLKSLSHVSWERALSGLFGFRNLASYLTKTGRFPALGIDLDGQDHPGKIVDDLAVKGHPLAIELLDMYAEFLGVEAANMAVKAVAVGGVYLSGGVARHLQTWLCSETFRQAFCRKGRCSSLLQSIPVYLITDPDSPLKGGGLLAEQSLKEMGS